MTMIELKGAPLQHVVLALGADMKNAVAVGYGRHVVLSPELGCLDDLDAVERFERETGDLPISLGHFPDTIAVDLHPDMQSSRFGRKLAQGRNLPLVEVQHHHAHAVACLAENGYPDGLVLVMDGTGWGSDGTVWGAELLDVKNDGTFSRVSSFAPVPLPGGDAAVRRPVRQVVGRWIQAGIALTDQRLMALDVTREEADVWEQQCRRKINTPLTHAAGRLFDAFSALLGIAPRDITYEGQPAIMLESAARRTNPLPFLGGVGVGLDEESFNSEPFLPFETYENDGVLLIDWAPAFRMVSDLTEARQDSRRWAMAVHVAVARAAGVMIDFGLSKTPERRVGLSGGVFMNQILNELLDRQLASAGITVLRHHETPPGDGCIALGQAVVAGRQ